MHAHSLPRVNNPSFSLYFMGVKRHRQVFFYDGTLFCPFSKECRMEFPPEGRKATREHELDRYATVAMNCPTVSQTGLEKEKRLPRRPPPPPPPPLVSSICRIHSSPLSLAFDNVYISHASASDFHEPCSALNPITLYNAHYHR